MKEMSWQLAMMQREALKLAMESEEVAPMENEVIDIDEENDDDVPIEVEEDIGGDMDESIDASSKKTDGPFGAATMPFASPFASTSTFGSTPAPVIDIVCGVRAIWIVDGSVNVWKCHGWIDCVWQQR
jgi:hypothetical protein